VARARAEAMGFTYKPANEVANLPLDDILRRISSISDVRTPVAVETAVLGGIEQPKVKMSEAFDIFCNEIRAAELAGKSEKQREQWKKVKKLAVSSFIAVVGDLAMIDMRNTSSTSGTSIGKTHSMASPLLKSSSGRDRLSQSSGCVTRY
jgi:hypothetical protein